MEKRIDLTATKTLFRKASMTLKLVQNQVVFFLSLIHSATKRKKVVLISHNRLSGFEMKYTEGITRRNKLSITPEWINFFTESKDSGCYDIW